jgi:GT2 family glycosyltransferase
LTGITTEITRADNTIPAVDDAPALSIVVVAYQQREALTACLESCLAATVQLTGDTELIVVNNGEIGELVRERCPQAQLIEPGFNVGFAGGVSRGIAVARGKWIALVNDDARIAPNALSSLMATGEQSPQIGAVASQVRFSDAPTRVNSAGISVDRLGIATERFAGAPIEAAAQANEVFGASACFALYRRAMLEQVGGFDERFFAYLEDVDLAWRARAAGWSCMYEPSAVAYHEGSASSGHASAGKYFLVGRNRVWLLARNATAYQLLRGLPGILLYDCAYIAYVALTDRTLAPLRGRLTGLRSWRQRRRERRLLRHPVALARSGWLAALGQHRAYRDLASRR